jgi:hypothetical protein
LFFQRFGNSVFKYLALRNWSGVRAAPSWFYLATVSLAILKAEKKLESSQQVSKFPSENVREEKFSDIISVTYANNYAVMLQAWDFKSSPESTTKVLLITWKQVIRELYSIICEQIPISTPSEKLWESLQQHPPKCFLRNV